MTSAELKSEVDKLREELRESKAREAQIKLRILEYKRRLDELTVALARIGVTPQ